MSSGDRTRLTFRMYNSQSLNRLKGKWIHLTDPHLASKLILLVDPLLASKLILLVDPLLALPYNNELVTFFSSRAVKTILLQTGSGWKRLKAFQIVSLESSSASAEAEERHKRMKNGKPSFLTFLDFGAKRSENFEPKKIGDFRTENGRRGCKFCSNPWFVTREGLTYCLAVNFDSSSHFGFDKKLGDFEFCTCFI